MVFSGVAIMRMNMQFLAYTKKIKEGKKMKETINFSRFCDRFASMGRENQFSYEGKKALFGYLEEMEEATGEEQELDVIALCCEYTEYKNVEEFQNDYGEEYENIQDIGCETMVIMIDGESFIIQNF